MVRIETKVDSAGIYYTGAEIVRKGSARLEKGTQTVYVCGLSGSVDRDTVRLYSSEGIRCANQRIETPDLSREETESKKIRREIEELNRRIGVKQMQMRLWETNGDFTGRATQSAEEIRDYIEKLPGRMDALNAEIAELQKKAGELEKDLKEALEKESLPVFAADINAAEEGVYPFELRYFEHRATWRPVYEIYSDAKEPLDLRMRASISQNTPEDWEDAAVSLYTGSPSMAGTLPELLPVFLNIRTQQPMAKNAFAGGMMMMGAARAAAPMAEDMEMACDEAVMMDTATVRMETESAEVSAEDTMTAYVLPGRRGLKKGDDGTMADLSRHTVPAEYHIAAAAGADPHAYLIAEVKTADIPFTRSISAAVYLKDKYVGTVAVDPELTKENIEITLGEEERVHVNRTEVSRKQSSALLKNQKYTDHVFETKVTNLTAEEVEVELRDQIPVSRDKEITVEAKDLGGAKLKEETGMVTRKMKVAAGATETFTISYRVSWPKDKNITEARSRKYCPVCGTAVSGTRFCPNCGSVV